MLLNKIILTLYGHKNGFYIHGEFIFSLGVDGEITETVKFPVQNLW